MYIYICMYIGVYRERGGCIGVLGLGSKYPILDFFGDLGSKNCSVGFWKVYDY